MGKLSAIIGLLIFLMQFLHGGIQHYSIDDGLSQSSITCLLTDHDGFLWVGTQDGLNRFDGYDFIKFTHQPFDTTSIVNNLIKDIDIDHQGNIWVITNSGICQYLSKEGRFTQYQFNQFSELLNNSEQLFSIAISTNDQIWVRGYNSLYLIDPKTRDVKEFLLQDFIPQPEYGLNYFPLETDHSGKLIFYSDKELLKTDGKNIWSVEGFGEFKKYELIKDIHYNSDSLIWVLTESRLIKFQNGLHNEYKLNDDIQQKLRFNFLLKENSNNFLIGSTSGLYRFNTFDNSFTIVQRFEFNGMDFSSESFISAFKDGFDILWLGTESGLIKYNVAVDKFNLISKSRNGYNNLLDDDIASIYIDNFQNIWLGTWGRGLQILNPQLEPTRYFTSFSSNKNDRLFNDYVHALYENKRGNILIGTRNGINIYDFTKNQLFSFSEKYLIPDSVFQNNRVYEFLENGYFLYIASYSGLFTYNYKSGNLKKIKLNETNPPVVYSLERGTGDQLWVGTDAGIYVLDEENLIIDEIRHSKIKEQNSLSSNAVYSLYNDHNKMWIGTDLGLNVYDHNTKEIEFFTEKDGLPNNLIYAIQIDINGDIWVSTNRGLSHFDQANREFINFDPSEGIQDYEYNLGASFQAQNGMLFFGGINGLNFFHPDSIQPNLIQPNLVVTAVEYSQGRELFQSVKVTQPIELDYPFTYLRISFASLDFRDTKKNKYRYSFHPVGEAHTFVNLDHDNYLTFSNLSPGNYELVIEGTNSDEVWSSKRINLSVIVHARIWNSKLAIIIYVLVIIGLVYLTFLFRTKSLRKLNKEYKERERINEQIARQKEELTIQNKNIRDSINYAKRIQEAMMPSKTSFRKLIPRSFILHKPKDIVSGDFYWINEHKEKIFVAAVDCTGHGVPGAFMSIIGYELFRRITNVEGVANPAEILNNLNSNFQDLFKDVTNISLKDGMDIAFCVIDKKNKIIEFAGAFNPLYILRDNKIIEIKGDRFSIGLDDEIFPNHDFTNHRFEIDEDDVIYIFSDGYADQFGGPEGKKFKYRRFRHLLLTIHKLPMETQIDILDKTIEEWRGDLEQVDDILIIGMVPLK